MGHKLTRIRVFFWSYLSVGINDKVHMADSKASFEIEGERPPKGRIERWGKIINEAGKNKLSLPEIERLQAVLIDNTKTLKIGIRKDGVFLGDRDRENEPIPEFIDTFSIIS